MYKKKTAQKDSSRFFLNEGLISSEQIRIIRTNLERIYGDKPALFMVTSLVEEGKKALVTSKLAISFAELGKRVLLVDANLRNPSLHNLFEFSNEHGLYDVMINGSNIQGYIQQTRFNQTLSLLPAGYISHNLSDIWNARNFEQMVSSWRKEFEVIILETPPYLTAADSPILANYCDGVILTVMENKTKKEDLLKVKESLTRTNSNILGVIFQRS